MMMSENDYETKVTLEVGGVALPDDLPFYILLLGDWSGQEKQNIARIKPIEVDRDNFENVLNDFAIHIDLNFEGESANTLSVSFDEFEDFHPDNLFRKLPLFSNLRDVRRRLTRSETFENAAREVRSWIVQSESAEKTSPESGDLSTEVIANHSDNLLDDILSQTDQTSTLRLEKSSQTSELDAFIKNIVKPHLIHTDTDEQSKLLIIVDEIISDLMRKIFHHPKFQSLESAWRGLHFLVRRAETSSDLKFFLLDISKSQLMANLKSVSDLKDSEVYKVFTRTDSSAVGEMPWAVICGNYDFALNVDDAAALIRIAKIAEEINAPFISSIAPEMLGLDSFELIDSFASLNIIENSTEEKLWTMLRALPEASSLALSMPRFMSRLPYGEKTDSTETFYFEEFTENFSHEKYVWSSSIFVVSLLLAQTFSQYGWELSNHFVQDVDGMPVCVYQEEAETKTKPVSETYMTHTNCEKILNLGLIPLISFKDSDRMRLASFQSIAYPHSPLKGRWE